MFSFNTLRIIKRKHTLVSNNLLKLWGKNDVVLRRDTVISYLDAILIYTTIK